MNDPSQRAYASHADGVRAWTPRLAPTMILAALFAAALWLFWNGVGPNDSEKYIRTALSWAENGLSLGADHWALRAPLVAPMAAMFFVFGPSELASIAPNIAYAAGLVGVTYIFGRRALGESAGLAAAALVATSAFFVGLQTEIWITGPDVFFAALACWLFIEATRGKTSATLLASAGIAAGGAWLCREVAIYLPLAFSILLLFRRPFAASALAAVVIGFGAVILAELVTYAVAAGNPLYRYLTDFGHRGTGEFYKIYADEKPLLHQILTRAWLPFNRVGTDVAIAPLLPLAMLAWMRPGFRRRALERPRRLTVVVFGACVAASFVLSAYAMNLKSPQYYPLLAYACLLTLGAFIGDLKATGRPVAAVALFTGIFALNAAIADFRSYDEQAEARRLARFALSADAPILTDHATALRARIFMQLAGTSKTDAEARIVSTIETPGAPCGLVYAATPFGLNRAIDPEPGWRELWSERVRRESWTRAVLSSLGADAIPLARLREVLHPVAPVALYEAPPCV